MQNLLQGLVAMTTPSIAQWQMLGLGTGLACCAKRAMELTGA